MNLLEEIRERDALSASTWFKEPAVGACGRAFIDRRWLLAEIERLTRENGQLREVIDSRDKALGFEPIPAEPTSVDKP